MLNLTQTDDDDANKMCEAATRRKKFFECKNIKQGTTTEASWKNLRIYCERAL